MSCSFTPNHRVNYFEVLRRDSESPNFHDGPSQRSNFSIIFLKVEEKFRVECLIVTQKKFPKIESFPHLFPRVKNILINETQTLFGIHRRFSLLSQPACLLFISISLFDFRVSCAFVNIIKSVLFSRSFTELRNNRNYANANGDRIL